MTIKAWIGAAVEGGWGCQETEIHRCSFGHCNNCGLCDKEDLTFTNEVFLDPRAWEAVGKVKGWPQGYEVEIAHGIIHYLFSGRTLEEYIATL